MGMAERLHVPEHNIRDDQQDDYANGISVCVSPHRCRRSLSWTKEVMGVARRRARGGRPEHSAPAARQQSEGSAEPCAHAWTCSHTLAAAASPAELLSDTSSCAMRRHMCFQLQPDCFVFPQQLTVASKEASLRRHFSLDDSASIFQVVCLIVLLAFADSWPASIA